MRSGTAEYLLPYYDVPARSTPMILPGALGAICGLSGADGVHDFVRDYGALGLGCPEYPAASRRALHVTVVKRVSAVEAERLNTIGDGDGAATRRQKNRVRETALAQKQRLNSRPARKDDATIYVGRCLVPLPANVRPREKGPKGEHWLVGDPQYIDTYLAVRDLLKATLRLAAASRPNTTLDRDEALIRAHLIADQQSGRAQLEQAMRRLERGIALDPTAQALRRREPVFASAARRAPSGTLPSYRQAATDFVNWWRFAGELSVRLVWPASAKTPRLEWSGGLWGRLYAEVLNAIGWPVWDANTAKCDAPPDEPRCTGVARGRKGRRLREGQPHYCESCQARGVPAKMRQRRRAQRLTRAATHR